MRFLKVVTSGIAVVVSIVIGVLATAIVAFAGLCIVLLARLLGRKVPPRSMASTPRERRVPAGDVIDITATELRSEPHSR